MCAIPRCPSEQLSWHWAETLKLDEDLIEEELNLQVNEMCGNQTTQGKSAKSIPLSHSFLTCSMYGSAGKEGTPGL